MSLVSTPPKKNKNKHMEHERFSEAPIPTANLEVVSLIEKYLAADQDFLSDSFQLPEFDYTQLGEVYDDGTGGTSDYADCTFVYVGKRRSGKTVAALNNLYAMGISNVIDGTVVMSRTEGFNYSYADHVLQDYIYDGWTPEVVSALEEEMKKMLYLTKFADDAPPAKVAIMLDDLISEEKFFFSRELSLLFAQGRHMYCNVHLITQYPLAIPPRVRVNADFVFMFRPMATAEYEKLWKDFGETLTRPAFYRLLRNATEGNSCLVYDGRYKKKICDRIRKDRKAATGYEKDDKKDRGARKAAIRKNDDENASIDEEAKGKLRDDENAGLYNPFEYYYQIQFPFPVPDFRFGTPEEWDKQEKEISDKVNQLRMGGETGTIFTAGGVGLASTYLSQFNFTGNPLQ